MYGVTAGQTWDLRDSRGETMYIVAMSDEPCAVGHFYILVLWAASYVHLEAGQYTHMDAQFIASCGSLLS
jgi:hypothetical protein